MAVHFSSALGRSLWCLWWVLACGQASAQVWDLSSSVERALDVAPELRAYRAEVSARQDELAQARVWSNPTLDVRVDEKLGIDDGRGGYDLTHVGVTQPLPVGRTGPRRRAAESSLAAAHEQRRYEQLQIEARTARAFHALQIATQRYRLAQERLAFAEGLGSGPDRLVRYLSPLERTRLDILRESARQEVASAEGQWGEAVAQFRVLLALAPDAQPQTVPLVPATAAPPFETLFNGLTQHPSLQAAQLTRDAGRAGVDLARAQRFAEPSISIFREKDYLAGTRQEYNGVVLGLQVPLWGLNNAPVTRARAEVDKAESYYDGQRRELEGRLRLSHMHVGHLIEQAEHYRVNVLLPARKLLDLTRKSFAAGEQGALALVDASNTYFDAQVHYLELVSDAWRESADLRLAAGVFISPAAEAQP
jgi:cobalt-zinc-cadmium efflux system outer membrane protein